LYYLIFRKDETTTDLNNNKTKANDSTSNQSPSQSKTTVTRGTTEVVRSKSNTGVNLQGSWERLSTEDNTIENQSVIAGVRRLGLQEIEHPDGKV
jgi:hypothetical protein